MDGVETRLKEWVAQAKFPGINSAGPGMQHSGSRSSPQAVQELFQGQLEQRTLVNWLDTAIELI